MLSEIYNGIKNDNNFQEAVKILSATTFHHYGDDPDIIFEETTLDNATDYCEEWSNGISKVVLIFDNFVLKTPITGCVWQIYDDNDEPIDDYEFDEDTLFDYCDLEVKLYDLAKKYGVEKFFAETIKIDYYVYMQEKYDYAFRSCRPDGFVEMKESFYTKGSFNYDRCRLYAANNHLNDIFRISKDIDIFISLLCLYSIKELQKLNDFISKFDIDDLHSGNVGWFGNNLKLIDFSGYETSTSDLVYNEIDE